MPLLAASIHNILPPKKQEKKEKKKHTSYSAIERLDPPGSHDLYTWCALIPEPRHITDAAVGVTMSDKDEKKKRKKKDMLIKGVGGVDKCDCVAGLRDDMA